MNDRGEDRPAADAEPEARIPESTTVGKALCYSTLALLQIAWIVWFFPLVIQDYLNVYTVDRNNSTVCPPNTIYAGSNSTGGYCLSPTGWGTDGVHGPGCADFDMNGTLFITNPFYEYGYCEVTDNSSLAPPITHPMDGEYFIDYACVQCNTETRFTPDLGVCFPCICLPTVAAWERYDSGEDTLRIVAYCASSLLCVLIPLYQGFGLAKIRWEERACAIISSLHTSVTQGLILWSTLTSHGQWYVSLSDGYYVLNGHRGTSIDYELAAIGLFSYSIMLYSEYLTTSWLVFTGRPSLRPENLYANGRMGSCDRWIFMTSAGALILSMALSTYQAAFNPDEVVCKEGNVVTMSPFSQALAVCAMVGILITLTLLLAAGCDVCGRPSGMWIRFARLVGITIPNLAASAKAGIAALSSAWSIATLVEVLGVGRSALGVYALLCEHAGGDR